MLLNQPHLPKFIYSLLLIAFFSIAMEEPSDWEVKKNQELNRYFPPASPEKDPSPEAPSFKLENYEDIANRLSENKMGQLLQEAPSGLKIAFANLIKNTTGPLSSDNILFEGPAGTGKTSLAFAIAYKCKTPYVFISGARIVNSSFKNIAPKFIEALFKTLKTNQRNTLIIDEFTAFTAKLHNRNDGDIGAVEEFWTALDEHKHKYNLIFMATTNEKDKIPGPLRDRFGETHHVGNPCKELRLLILKDSPLVTGSKFDLEKLVTQTNGFSLRDLELLHKTAAGCANLRDPNSRENTPITINDIHNALQCVKKSSDVKAKDVAEKTDHKNWESFNRYKLPIVSLAIASGISIIGIGINYSLTKENNTKALALQHEHHLEQMKASENNHQSIIAQNKKFHEDNIQLQKTQFQEQIYNQTKNTLLQGVAVAAANAPIVNTVLTESVCEGVDFTVDLAVRSITILNPLPFPIRTRTFIKPIIRPLVQYAIPYVIAFSPQWVPLVIKSESKSTINKNAK